MGELLTTVEDLTGAATRVQQRGHNVSDQVNAFIDDYILALEEHRHMLLKQVGHGAGQRSLPLCCGYGSNLFFGNLFLKLIHPLTHLHVSGS